MKFFLDSANIDEIKTCSCMGIINGVTTNPSLISKNIKEINKFDYYSKICKIVQGDVSIEVVTNTYNDIIKEGHMLSEIADNIVIKLPMNNHGLKACRYFSNIGIKTNVTLVFSSIQAILAANFGATYVSPFLGRVNDICYKGIDLIKDIKAIYRNYSFNTKILGASIRSVVDIIECAKIGIDYITIPYTILNKLIEHPLTNIGLEIFMKDYNDCIKK